MRVSGGVPGSITITEYGQVAAFGVSAVHDSFSKNIIAEKCALEQGWSSEKLKGEEFYTLTHPDHRDVVFKVDSWGTYSMSIEEFQDQFPSFYKSANPVDVSIPPQRLAFTQPQRDRANMVTHYHHRSLMHVSMHQLEAALKANLLLNAPYRAKDVQHAVQLQAPCEPCIKFKGTRPAAKSTYSASPDTPGPMIAADILYLCGVPYLFTLEFA
jgi:hypothetical protein